MADEVLDVAVLDAPAVDTQTQDVTETSETPVDQATSATSPSGETETQTDGRRGPANIRNSIKAASEALPEQAGAFKELGAAYFREQAYKQAFPSPQEAVAAKQLITDIGGVEGIAGLQTRVQTYDAQDSAFKDGNPEVLNSFFKDFPEGAAALAPHYLEKLQQLNPEAFASAVGPIAISMLEQAGVAGHLDAMLNEADPQRAKALIQQLKQWFDGQRGNAQQLKQSRQSTANDPRAKQIREQQEALNKERDQIFADRVSEKVNSGASSEIAKAADPFVKQYKLGDEQKSFFVQQLGQKIVDELNADSTYKKQIDIRKAAKDKNPQAIADYMLSEVKSRLPNAALALAKQMYGGSRPAQQQQAQQQRPAGGRIFVSERPPSDQLQKYPGYELDWIKGFGKRLNGQEVTWRK